MPELPEVEVIMRGVASGLLGRTITAVNWSRQHLRLSVPYTDLRKWIVGVRVKALSRRAKYGLIDLDNGARLVLHFGMTGKLRFCSSTEKPLPHDHIFFDLDTGIQMRFNDVRRFGSVQVFGPEDPGRERFFATLGPEPFDEQFHASYLKKRAAKRVRPVKNFLMDSHVVVGIGNIYASEILFRARVCPKTPVGRISHKRWQRIITETRQVLKEAIDAGGSSIADFVNSSGEKGYFQVNFQVYGRHGQPCVYCGRPLVKEVLAGRATYSCRTCQRR